MPGKVNPVIPEVVTQVAAQVIGNDVAITVGGMQGHFELNVFVPLLARNLLDSIKLLASASRLFAEKCVDGIEANRETCERYAELTLSAATALNPYIGYDKAAEIVKEAAASGRSLREVAREAGVDDAILDEALDYRKMAKPHDLVRLKGDVESATGCRRLDRGEAAHLSSWRPSSPRSRLRDLPPPPAIPLASPWSGSPTGRRRLEMRAAVTASGGVVVGDLSAIDALAVVPGSAGFDARVS